MNSHILSEIAQKHNLRRRSGRYVGPCPVCGGSERSDKFNLRDDGGFKCYGCDFKGDIITWFRKIDGMSCPQAHTAAGKECQSATCSVYATCSMGNSGTRVKRQPLKPAQRQEKQLPEPRVKSAREIWKTWAADLVDKAVLRLQENSEMLSWLDSRGIDKQTASRFRLGLLDHDRKVKRSTIGLGPREDGKETLWVPSGLLIPILEEDGSIHRLRVRRGADSREKFLSDLKYLWIEGSGTAPLYIPSSGERRGAVIVEAELDAFACAAAHSDVDVIGLGTVSAGVHHGLREKLSKCGAVLVALDADAGDDESGGAGPRSIGAWVNTFRQAKYWPVLEGKDPGDYAKAGGDLREWIEAGLPQRTPRHELPVSAGRSHRGERGEEKQGAGGKAPKSFILTLSNGCEIHVVEDEFEWKKLVEMGETVFSRGELLRLQEATKRMSGEEKTAAAMQAVEVKRLFGGYIRSGTAHDNCVPQ